MEQNYGKGRSILVSVLLIAWLIVGFFTPIPYDGVAAAAVIILRGGINKITSSNLISEK